VSGLRHVGRGKVGDDTLDDHVRMLSASALLHHVSYGSLAPEAIRALHP
jgi:hypothetical protein